MGNLKNKKSNRIIYTFIFMVGILLSALSALFINKTIKKDNHIQFQLEAGALISSVERQISMNLSILPPMTAFFNASNHVSRDEFALFNENIFNEKRYDLQAFSWNPRVKSEERAQFEENAQSDGLTDFQFRERHNGILTPAHESDEYFPVYYIEPYEGNEAALGFNIKSSPERFEALKHSRDSAQMIATEAIRLVQEKEEQFGFLVCSPIYKGASSSVIERRRNLLGFTVGVFRISDIMEKACAQIPSEYNLEVTLFESLPSGEKRQIYPILDDESENAITDQEDEYPFFLSSEVEVINRNWELNVFTYTPIQNRVENNYQAIITFLVGGIITILLLLYLRNIEKYTKEIEVEITERIAFEKRLNIAKKIAEDATKSKSQFLANMSHEIRTPMSAIIGFTEILLETDISNTQKRHLQIVNKSANNLLILINDILDTSKLENNKLLLEKAPFNLPDAISIVVAILSEKAIQKGVFLTQEYAPSLATLFVGDKNRIMQVLINLVDNAIKFTPSGGTVSLQVAKTAEDKQVFFAITDNGIGMSSKVKGTLFEPFVQADETISRTHGGTGLGTTISKQLVELMNGEIWVESEVGEGSSIQFTIELEEFMGKLPDPKIAMQEILNVQDSLNILLAEDIPENAELTILRLTQMSHVVTRARNGEEAVKFFETKGPFDIILMDIHMPIMDGLTATKNIRKLEKISKSHTPILAMSASVMNDERERYTEAGIDDVVTKPIDFKSLVTKINKVVPKSVGIDMNTAPLKKEGFPLLVGVDTLDGLERWGNSDTYLQNLLSFAQSHRNDVKEIGQAIRDNRVMEARELLHALSGVAGNLAMSKVVSTVEELSAMLRNDTHFHFESVLQSLAQELTKVIESIEQQCNEVSQKNEIIEKEFSLDKVIPLMVQLHQALSSNRTDDECLDKLVIELTGSIKESVIVELKSSIHNFAFKNAQRVIESIAESLKIELKG